MPLGLVQEMRQRQVLSMHQRQSLHLLEAPLQELAQVVRQAAENNPLLEIVEPATVSIDAARENYVRGPAAGPDAAPDADSAPEGPPSDAPESTGAGLSELDPETLDDLYSEGGNNEYDPDAEERRQFFFDSIPARESLDAHLAAQLPGLPIAPEDRPLAERIAGSVDADGYLRTPLAEIAQGFFADLPRTERILALLQSSLSPAGVCARDLRECLALQLRAAEPGEHAPLALRLAEDPGAFALLEKRRFDRIAERLGATEAEVAAAVRDLASLDPAPGRRFETERPAVVNPEIVVRREGGRWVARLDDSVLPRVRVSPFYKRRMERLAALLAGRLRAPRGAADPLREEKRYLDEKAAEAEQLARGLGDRQETLLRVAQAVVDRQPGYFERGLAGLRPLTMSEIAKAVGINESTVSRAVGGKYLRSPRGVEELRKFFTNAIKTADGDALSSDDVRDRLRRMIAAEDPANPLSDQAIADRFAAEGVPIARRTVVKYRTRLRIPSSAERRAP